MPGIFALLAAAGVGFGAGTLYQSHRIRSMNPFEFHMWAMRPSINSIVVGTVAGEMLASWIMKDAPPCNVPTCPCK